MAEVQHERVYFSGRVQGVGFRYAVLQVAKEFEVAGYVQNLADGRVLLDVEGAEIAALVEAVGERMHGFVQKTERVADSRPPQFQGFEIRPEILAEEAPLSR
ncbi:acylphosphatase [Cephaloticoccus primus]|uniref:acylphosphatase n=1 Tax=Cephaloticoccus primus TaxID=1548207 RepID=A0A139SPI4_9BACT|nr:acylphosphatase [Cephaloticoccus primus]KXU36515.1 acylphosphatase [Cephaloticoccus primus]